MTDAPQTIWVHFEYDEDGYPMFKSWETEKPPSDAVLYADDPEYTRTDTIPTRIAELEGLNEELMMFQAADHKELIAQARNDALEEAALWLDMIDEDCAKGIRALKTPEGKDND